MGPSNNTTVNIMKTEPENRLIFQTECSVGCVLTLDSKFLNTVPDGLFQPEDLQDARDLSLTDTILEELPDSFTHHLVNVLHLKLRNNKLKKLPHNLGKLLKLENLDLSQNYLETLPINFDLLASLKFLNIASNRLNCVPNCLFSMQLLQNLSVSKNNLSSIPEEIGQLTNLLSLDVSGNYLESLPESFSNLTRLTELNVSVNRLKSIPDSLIRVTGLRILNISHNQISELPLCIRSGMAQLSQLDISYNLLTFLDNTPRCIHSLMSFNASNNLLMSVPHWLFEDSCRQLRHVDLRANCNMLGLKQWHSAVAVQHSTSPVTYLDVSSCCLKLDTVFFLFGLSSLDTLHIGNQEFSSDRYVLGNMFLTLPINVLTTCSSLRELHIPRVGLTDLPETLGHLAPHLELLDISNNDLHWLPDSFCQLHSLTCCLLSCNSLILLPSDVGQLVQLKRLALNSNRLESLPDSMQHLSQLTFLDLYDNMLDVLPGWLVTLPRLEALDMEKNYFHISKCSVQSDFVLKYEEWKKTLRLRLYTIDREDTSKPLQISDDPLEESSSSSTESDGRLFLEDDDLDLRENFILKNSKDPQDELLNDFQSLYIDRNNIEYNEEDDWNSIDEPDSYFDPNVIVPKHVPPKTIFETSDTLGNFCPVDLHQQSIAKRHNACQSAILIENGQFDDAD